MFTQHPTRVTALPAGLRPAAEKAGKDRLYLKDVDPRWPIRRGTGHCFGRPRVLRLDGRA
jgi:hypothetical protein